MVNSYRELRVWNEGIALESLGELETQMIIANQVDYVSQEVLKEILVLTDKIGRMIVKLNQNLRSKLSDVP